MKTNIIKTIAAFFSVAVTAVGCIQETFPMGSTQTADQVGKSPVALEAMANSLPAAMMTTNTAGYYTGYSVHTDFGIPAIHLMTEFMLEDIATSGDNPYYNRFYAQALNQNQGSTYIYCAYFWSCYYQWIKGTNDIISSIDPETTNPTIAKILGQAYAYRAMFYLDLARMFEPKETKVAGYDVSKVLGLTVPIITETTKETDATNNPRATREEMYAFILSDLDNAAKYLDGVTTTYTSPSIHVVNGLRARAYLEMGAAGDEGAYVNAAKYARLVIDESGKTPLTEAQWHDPSTGFNDGGSNNAWLLGFKSSAENLGNIICFTAHLSTEATWGYAPLAQYCASKSFYEQISYNDFRKYSWLDPEREKYMNKYKFAGTPEDASLFLNGNPELSNPAALPYETLKFRPAGGEVHSYSSGNVTDHCMMRIEEMYFIEMEAKAAMGDLGGAGKLLDDFMKLRYTTGTYSCTRYTDSFENFAKEMLFQKRVEFWGEGIVFFDYKRLNIGITRGYPGTNHAAVYCLNCEGRSPQWNFVITRGEFQSNKGITDETNNPDPSGLLPLWVEQ